MTNYAVTATKRKSGPKKVIKKDLMYRYDITSNNVQGEICINKAATTLASNDTLTVTLVDGT